ncbi:AAA family ATPase [Thalassotalea psychrophila]|uniref:AAA family ATPase n=1 Tax=Thalassotalea psychrophila TaxID=3065647 RepID=A0ABY9U186_9GAMM|nr:AAA family ATPase [Colwelliaceae bacterium SQ149]
MEDKIELNSIKSYSNVHSNNENKNERRSMSLPFLIKLLLVCDDPQVESATQELLLPVKNLDLIIEKKVTFITEDFQVAVVVYTGDELQTISNLEKISNAGINILIVGDNLPQKLLRKSIQLSIKDIVPLSTAEVELVPAISEVASQLKTEVNLAPVVSIINGKGGSGASFIASSVGQIISNHSKDELVMIDADLQHGTLADSLNLQPDYYLDDALADIKELDATAIQSMMSKKENLSLLPVKAYSQINRLAHIDQNKISQLFSKVRANFKLLIADLSRGIDSLSIPILESSEHIMVVVQQNISSIREAKALVEQLHNIMGIAPEKISIIVNRYSTKFSTITPDDIKNTVGVESVFTISNDYQLASACTDLGKSIDELSEFKQLEKEFLIIAQQINASNIDILPKTKSLWSRLTGKS